MKITPVNNDGEETKASEVKMKERGVLIQFATHETDERIMEEVEAQCRELVRRIEGNLKFIAGFKTDHDTYRMIMKELNKSAKDKGIIEVKDLN